MTQEEIRGAVARGWCHDKNAWKDFDSDLALAISEEIEKLLAIRQKITTDLLTKGDLACTQDRLRTTSTLIGVV